jgi:hypothetical protein
MNTPLVMNSAQAVDGPCGSNGAIAQDGTGRVLSCQAGHWKLAGDGRCQFIDADLNTLQEDGRCYNGAGLPNSPAGADWVFLEVYRHVNTGTYFLTQRVVGMTGAAIGRTWSRTQNSGSSAGGWSSWTQQSDPQVAIGGGTGSVFAAGHLVGGGTVQGSFLYSTENIQAASGVYSSYVESSGNIIGSGIFANYIESRGDMAGRGNHYNFNGSHFNTSDTWAFLGYSPDFGANAEPTAERGSAYLNDVFLRSRGQWVSQMNRNLILRAGEASAGGTSVASCSGSETLVAGSCYGIDNCSGNDSSMHGGFPSGKAWVCPGWPCNTTFSFATCME